MKRTEKREEFLADILTTAIEGGINDWAEVHEYRWENLAHRDYFAVIADMEDEDFEPVKITIDTIAKGIGVIKSWKKEKNFEPNYFGDGGAYWRQFLLADRTNGDDGDYDAIVADWIVQAGIFGEIVYG